MIKLRQGTNLALLLFGGAVSTFCNALVLVALLVHLAGLADSARQIGLVQGSAYLPMALFSYVAGAWVDRHRPRSVMVWTDVLRGLAMIAGGLVLAAAPGAGMAVLLPLVFVMGTLQSLFIPGLVLLCVSFERQLAAHGRRIRVLGLRNAGTHVATLAGNALGGGLYLLLGLPALLVSNGLGFILSAASMSLLQLGAEGRQAGSDAGLPPPATLPDQLRTVLGTAPVDLYLLVQMAVPLLTMLLPTFLTQVLGLSAQTLGPVFALLLAGSITAGLSSGLGARRHAGKSSEAAGAETQPGRSGTSIGRKGLGATRLAYLPGLLAGLILAAIAIPGKALPWPVGAALLVGLGYCLGILYLRSVEAVQWAALSGSGGRGHGMLESLSSIVTPASYFIGGAVLGSGGLGGGGTSATVWIVGLAGILAAYSLMAGLRARD